MFSPLPLRAWLGGPRRLTMYLATLDCATSNPSETEQPDHSASLGDSITSSTRMRFSVHTGVISSRAILGGLHHHYARCLSFRYTQEESVVRLSHSRGRPAVRGIVLIAKTAPPFDHHSEQRLPSAATCCDRACSLLRASGNLVGCKSHCGLTVVAPEHWVAVSNTLTADIEPAGNAKVRSGRRALDDAEAARCGPPRREPEATCGEELPELGLTALQPSDVDKHVQVHQCAELERDVPGRDAFGQYTIEDDQATVGRDYRADVAEDLGRVVVIPVVDDPPHDVRVPACGNGLEKAPGNQFAAVRDAALCDDGTRRFDDMRQVEQDAARRGGRSQDRRQQPTLPAAGVDDGGEAREAIRGPDLVGAPRRAFRHGPVEGRREILVLLHIFEQFATMNLRERSLARTYRVEHLTPRWRNDLSAEHQQERAQTSKDALAEEAGELGLLEVSIRAFREDSVCGERAQEPPQRIGPCLSCLGEVLGRAWTGG